MEYSIVNLTERNIDEYTQYFDQITQKVIKQLAIDKAYCLSVIFVDDAKIREINREYRHKDMATDVISFAALDDVDDFELEQEEIEIGDIFISIDAIIRQATEYGHSTQREASFLFTHGLLHLLGYDHQDEASEKKMFALQDVILDDIIKR